MNSAATPAPRGTNPVLVLVRLIVVTIAFGVLGMGVGGLMGIVVVSIINATGLAMDMYMALFGGAVPGALIGAAVGLVVIVRSERKAIQASRQTSGV